MAVGTEANHSNDMKGNIIHIRDTLVGIRKNSGNPRPDDFPEIISRNEKMMEVLEQIRKVSRFEYPVHIYGKTGTGKELIAEAVHQVSLRKNETFVPVNCGALPESLIESELFGHEKGAFTGAVRTKKGRFELADEGTIFLDEVADLSKYIQVKLLRVLQEGKFERVGGEKTISVNVRVISATNKDLKKEVNKNRFRADLYYRLNVVPIHIPRLNERKNDIPLLVHHFLKQAHEQYALPVEIQLTEEAMMMLMDYNWPGNVRELQNMIQYAFVQSDGVTIEPANLPGEIRSLRPSTVKRGPSKKLDIGSVRFALEKTGGNKAEAARRLGVGRATLYRFFSDFPDAGNFACASVG